MRHGDRPSSALIVSWSTWVWLLVPTASRNSEPSNSLDDLANKVARLITNTSASDPV